MFARAASASPAAWRRSAWSCARSCAQASAVASSAWSAPASGSSSPSLGSRENGWLSLGSVEKGAPPVEVLGDAVDGLPDRLFPSATGEGDVEKAREVAK